MLVTDVVAYKIFWEVSGKTLHDIIDVHSTTIFTFDPSFVTIYQGLQLSSIVFMEFQLFFNNFLEQLSGAIFVAFSIFTFEGSSKNGFHWLFRLIGYWNLSVLSPISVNPEISACLRQSWVALPTGFYPLNLLSLVL